MNLADLQVPKRPEANTEEAILGSLGTRQANEVNSLPEMPSQQPNVDTRVKTEDVTNTKGLSFRDFNLGKDIQLVCK